MQKDPNVLSMTSPSNTTPGLTGNLSLRAKLKELISLVILRICVDKYIAWQKLTSEANIEKSLLLQGKFSKLQ